IGRLTHHCHLILFPGENNRLRESSINELYRSMAVQDARKED
ncbi:MAG: ATP-binding protein, partial [Desulfitobacteriaceae bacterium]|nr:ATP-binding protein [Desulfitobacteriaceae bacterium]